MKEFNHHAVLRIYIGEADQIGHEPLYEKIIYEARKQGLAGGTVIRGIMSYGSSSRLHTAKLLDIAENLPIIVEILDTHEKVRDFAQAAGALIDAAHCGGLVTVENADILIYKHAKTA